MEPSLNDQVAEMNAKLASLTAKLADKQPNPNWIWKYKYRVKERCFLDGFTLDTGDWYGSDKAVYSPSALTPDDEVTAQATERERIAIEERRGIMAPPNHAETVSLREEIETLRAELASLKQGTGAAR